MTTHQLLHKVPNYFICNFVQNLVCDHMFLLTSRERYGQHNVQKFNVQQPIYL
jgi:hypothetical protein